jgi:hypothetical protein
LGERLVVEMDGGGAVALVHLYADAADFVHGVADAGLEGGDFFC